MPRTRLVLPDRMPFSTEIDIRITDINYGGHLGNDAVLGIIHEARLRFLAEFGYSEMDVEGVGIILTDAIIVFRSEAFRGESIRIDVGAANWRPTGCDIVYRLSGIPSEREIARAKTGIAFFDYERRKTVARQPSFADL